MSSQAKRIFAMMVFFILGGFSWDFGNHGLGLALGAIATFWFGVTLIAYLDNDFDGKRGSWGG